MDILTRKQRSEVMRCIRNKDTKPEILLRSALHRSGFRFRLHRRSLPGSPDIVFPGQRKVIFVHGCFWHSHRCKFGRKPASNRAYWIPKLAENKKRDVRNRRRLTALGWHTMVVWECQLQSMGRVMERVKKFLEE